MASDACAHDVHRAIVETHVNVSAGHPKIKGINRRTLPILRRSALPGHTNSADVNEMTTSDGSLPKIADVENERLYGYVFGVSGPGELDHRCRSLHS